MVRGCAGRRTVTAPANEPYPFPLEESLVIAVDSSAVAVCVSPGEHLPAHPLRLPGARAGSKGEQPRGTGL